MIVNALKNGRNKIGKKMYLFAQKTAHILLIPAMIDWFDETTTKITCNSQTVKHYYN